MWDFIQDQVLGMKWLNEVIGKGVSLLGLDTSSRWGGSVQFFLYDTLKITVLLCILIFGISYVQSYFPPERSKKILGRFHGVWANIIGALLGTVTPFCSCSSIPLFIGFTSAGLPLGVTFSFLISSPMVDLGSLVLLMSIFGTKVAIVYVIMGLVIAVIGGTLIERIHMEPYVEEFIRNASSVDIDSPHSYAEGTIDLCKRSGYFHVQEGVSVHSSWRRNWGAHSQLDSRKLDRRHPGEQQSLWRCAGYGDRRSHVCGHLWHDPRGGGFAGQRGLAGNRPCLYDGGHDFEPSLPYHAP